MKSIKTTYRQRKLSSKFPGEDYFEIIYFIKEEQIIRRFLRLTLFKIFNLELYGIFVPARSKVWL